MSEADDMRNAVLGNPPSPTHQPDRNRVVDAFEALFDRVIGLTLGFTTYDTVADLPAVTVADDGTMARVTDDPTTTNNTFWVVVDGTWQIDTGLTSFLQIYVDDAETAAAGVNESIVPIIDSIVKDYQSLVGLYGGSSFSEAANLNGMSRAYDCGTDFDADFIDGVRALVTPTNAVIMSAKVYERLSTSADLNSAPGATDDVLVSSGSVTKDDFEALGKIVPVKRYKAVDGRVYLAVLEAYEADGTTRVAIRYNFSTVADLDQRFKGFQRIGASGYTNFTSTRSLSVGFVTANLIDIENELELVQTDFINRQENAYRQMIRSNDAEVRGNSFMDPIGSGVSVRFGGDSLCSQTTGSPARVSSAVVDLLLDGATVINVGVGGQTAAQINATLSARDSAEWGWSNFINASTNDEASADYDGLKASIDGIISQFTGEWIFTPAIRSGGIMSNKQRRLLRELRSTPGQGARIWDWDWVVKTIEDYDIDLDVNTGDADDDSQSRFDGLHLSSLGCTKLGLEQTRLIRAMNGGAPYVHEEVLPLRSDDDPTSVVYSDGLILGSAQNVTIVEGYNEDDAIDLNANTGALGRGAGTLKRGSREIIVRAENEYGSHEARKTFLISRSDSNPTNEVEFFGAEEQCPRIPPLGSTADGIGSPTKMSFFISLRFTKNWGGNIDPGILIGLSGQSLRVLARNTSGALIGNSPILPQSDDPFAANGFFISIDTDAGTITYSTNEDSASSSFTGDGIGIRTSNIDKLFMSTGAYLRGVAMRRYMMFAGHAFDFTDAAIRALFYDPVTRMPKDIGANATVNGQQAAIDLFGHEGDYVLGNNPGTIGDLLPPTYRGYTKLTVRDVT